MARLAESRLHHQHTLDTVAADKLHRAHAVVELAIRDLKDSGLEHVPSGHYHANGGAWLAATVLAHNLNRWVTALADQTPVNNRTMRTRLTALAAVLVNRSGRHALRSRVDGHGLTRSPPPSLRSEHSPHPQAEPPAGTDATQTDTSADNHNDHAISFDAYRTQRHPTPPPFSNRSLPQTSPTARIGGSRLNAASTR